MRELWILNESRTADRLGDLSVFLSLSALIRSIEAIDVRNGEYYAFCTDGRRVVLTAATEYSPVEASVERSFTCKHEVKSLLRQYLDYLHKVRPQLIEWQALSKAKSIEELVALIPEEAIERA